MDERKQRREQEGTDDINQQLLDALDDLIFWSRADILVTEFPRTTINTVIKKLEAIVVRYRPEPVRD